MKKLSWLLIGMLMALGMFASGVAAQPAGVTAGITQLSCDGYGEFSVNPTGFYEIEIRAENADTNELLRRTEFSISPGNPMPRPFNLRSMWGLGNVRVSAYFYPQKEPFYQALFDCSGDGLTPTSTPVTPQPTAPVVPTPTPVTPQPTAPLPTATTAPGITPTPVANAFALTSANRACADQRFSATWTGSNLTSVEFALSNTSDNWTSGWLSADPASGSFTSAVDHHGYDKVMARATFTDGTTSQQDADVGTCTEAPVPPPSKPAPSQPGGATSLPKTGAGVVDSGSMLMASVLLAATFIAGVGLRKRYQA
ncbi:MAG: hypothetical protein M9953_07140 [Thermomicrobiales bacterium]|nr:hypothetical protein [Thermomicrobiales bacterium]